ncbi:sugar transferase [Candidatus Phaeomarinobacter ectocarpi]|nr:sugar transferase [Candidatus Phaeomarinobacter ectocarpi]
MAHTSERELSSKVRLIHDLFWVTCALPLALTLRHAEALDADFFTSSRFLPQLYVYMPVLWALALATFFFTGSHTKPWRAASHGQLFYILRLSAVVSLGFLGVAFLIQSPSVGRSVPFLYAMGLTLGMILGHRLLLGGSRPALANQNMREWVPVIIFGTDRFAEFMISMAQATPYNNLCPVAVVSESGRTQEKFLHGVPVVGDVGNLDKLMLELATQGIHPVATCRSPKVENWGALAGRRIDDFVARHRLKEIGRTDFLSTCIESSITSTGDVPMLAAQARTHSVSELVKRILDVAIAVIATILLLPVFAAVWLLVVVDMGRPAMFVQVRPGRYCAPFKLYKFRTLKSATGPVGAPLADDLRQTRIGRVLRRLRLDELPQLFNVIAGQMSLVGPRPWVLTDLDGHGTSGDFRFQMRPGVTGWAQVNGGRVLDVEAKLKLDRWYCEHANLWLDARILLKTMWIMFAGEHVDEKALRDAGIDPVALCDDKDGGHPAPIDRSPVRNI